MLADPAVGMSAKLTTRASSISLCDDSYATQAFLRPAGCVMTTAPLRTETESWGGEISPLDSAHVHGLGLGQAWPEVDFRTSFGRIR
jgi:hypothetical protein